MQVIDLRIMVGKCNKIKLHHYFIKFIKLCAIYPTICENFLSFDLVQTIYFIEMCLYKNKLNNATAFFRIQIIDFEFRAMLKKCNKTRQTVILKMHKPDSRRKYCNRRVPKLSRASKSYF